MLPELAEAVSVPSTRNNAPDTPTASQHGFLRDDLPSSSSSISGEREESGANAAKGALAPSTGLRPPDVVEEGEERLSKRAASYPRNCIAEYEDASSPSPGRSYPRVEFKVAKKDKKPGDKSSPLANFPNGGLHGLDLLWPKLTYPKRS